MQSWAIILFGNMSDKSSECYVRARQNVLLGCILLGAFALRIYHLGQQPLSWDEGWSIGLSRLPWSEIDRITALDVHPPLYYYVLKCWLAVGRQEGWVRLLSVAASIFSVALAFVTARTWSRSSRVTQDPTAVGLLAATLVAGSPFLIYYAQVARMFSLCVMCGLLATYCLLRLLETDYWLLYLGFVLGAVAAAYSFYYSALAIAAALIYVAAQRPRLWRRVLIAVMVCALLYLPWLSYAVPPMLSRVGTRTGFSFSVADVAQFLKDGIFGLAFAYGAGWYAVYATLLVLLLGLLASGVTRRALRLISMPAMAIVLTLLAVSVGAKAHMFAARYLIMASPFLSLWLAWSVAACWRRRWWLGFVVSALLVASASPTLGDYVYQKAYEVSEPFDPQADYRFLENKLWPEDLLFYNVLSLAGHYERFRRAGDPAWSYVLRWDPVVEPLATAQERIMAGAREHRRLWFVLYKGTYGANQELKEWLDMQLYPSWGAWRDDTLYLQYLPASTAMAHTYPRVAFGGSITLQQVAYNTASDGPITVQLVWSTESEMSASYKVFVHLYAADGSLVAQHDSVPVNELRPTSSWKPRERIADNHGLWIPPDAVGPLRLVVGLYDSVSGVRVTLPDGSDCAELGLVRVT